MEFNRTRLEMDSETIMACEKIGRASSRIGQLLEENMKGGYTNTECEGFRARCLELGVQMNSKGNDKSLL